jgi:cytidylate kinase
MISKITISGKICTGKSSVFKGLLARLHWPTFASGAYFREVAKTNYLNLNTAAEQTDTLTHQVDTMVKQMLEKPGNLLLDAWLGGILAEDAQGVLRVLLTADDAVRFSRFAKREHVSLAEAEREVNSRDTNWFAKVKKIHARSDFFEKEKYDLVIDTSSLEVEQVVQKILSHL